MGRTTTIGVILKTNEKLILNWNELLLVGSLESNLVEIRSFLG